MEPSVGHDNNFSLDVAPMMEAWLEESPASPLVEVLSWLALPMGHDCASTPMQWGNSVETEPAKR